MQKSLLSRLHNEDGLVMVMTNFAVLLLLAYGAVLLQSAGQEGLLSQRQKSETIALHIAEAGLERGLYDLRQDFINDTTPSWSDSDINGMAIGPDTSNYYTIPYSDTSFNGGSYQVEIQNVAGEDHVWVQSTGTIGDVSTTVRAYARMINLSPWDAAIFAGSGASGSVINGNVDIRGSVHILGNGLSAGDYAIDLGGTAEIVGNNYAGLSSSLEDKIPDLPTVDFNGETVETLNSILRVKQGLVGLSGSSTVGEADVAGNSVKETVDAVYVTDGYGGSSGVSSVYSDNGTSTGYDLGDNLSFPSLSDPHPTDTSQTYQAYYKSQALVLTNELSSITPGSSFSYSNSHGSIALDGSGNMTISGQVYVDGNNDVTMSKSGPNNTISYTGAGTLMVTGNVQIDINMVTSGNDSFPSNVMGVMTPNNIDFNGAGIDVMGAFYAENTIAIQKQTDLIGTVVSNYIDMGTNVPSVYQVPELVNHLPPGMIAQDATWYMVIAWQKM